MNTAEAPTLADLRQQPHWSFSSLNTFLNICSLEWAFRYAWRVPPAFTPAALVFGSAFHAACTFAFRTRQETGVFPVAGAVDAFADLLQRECRTAQIPPRFKEGETVDGLILQGRRMLQALLTDPVCCADEILSVGEVFTVPLPDADGAGSIPLIGEYDLVLRDAKGITVVDWKTSSRRWPKAVPTAISSPPVTCTPGHSPTPPRPISASTW